MDSKHGSNSRVFLHDAVNDVHKKGSKTVTMRDTKNGDSRVTVAVSITADGEVLKPFVVMKGKLLCNNLLFFVFFVRF